MYMQCVYSIWNCFASTHRFLLSLSRSVYKKIESFWVKRRRWRRRRRVSKKQHTPFSLWNSTFYVKFVLVFTLMRAYYIHSERILSSSSVPLSLSHLVLLLVLVHLILDHLSTWNLIWYIDDFLGGRNEITSKAIYSILVHAILNAQAVASLMNKTPISRQKEKTFYNKNFVQAAPTLQSFMVW